MTPDELRTAATDIVARKDGDAIVLAPINIDGVALCRALLAALSLIDQARAHRDLEGAVAAFDRAVEELRP